MSHSQIQTAVTLSKNLLAFYNANTAGAPVKKFADRKTAERRVLALIEELLAEKIDESIIMESVRDGTIALNDDEEVDASYEDMVNLKSEQKTVEVLKAFDKAYPSDTAASANALAAKALISNAHPSDDVCPNCGGTEDITAGRIVDRGGKQILVDTDYFTHHGCGHEWGRKDSVKKVSASAVITRPEMAASMKLDRTIICVETGLEYANAFQVYKAGRVTSGQCDRLSAVLYGAAKKGDRTVQIVIAGSTFTLANE
jgi:hypothetical protein